MCLEVIALSAYCPTCFIRVDFEYLAWELSQTMANPPRKTPEQFSTSGMPVNAAESVAESPLFRLPRELRDQIYKIALELSLPLDYVTVTRSGLPEPALLTTCKTIRREAIGIHYSTSSFTIEIYDYHPAAAVLWRRKWESLEKQYGVKERCFDSDHQLYTSYAGHENWKNLKLWLQFAHEGMCGAPGEMDIEHKAEKRLIYALFGTVMMIADKPWEDAEFMLETFHPVLVSLNRKWK